MLDSSWHICFVGSSCFIYVNCIYLRMLMSNTISYQIMFVSFKNTTWCVTCGVGTANPSGANECTPGFLRGSCFSIFSFMRCGSLFVLLLFYFWPLYCLFYFDLRLLITLCIFENEINFDETTIRFNSVVKQRIFISKMKKKSSF
jgi:hypothetical protein